MVDIKIDRFNKNALYIDCVFCGNIGKFGKSDVYKVKLFKGIILTSEELFAVSVEIDKLNKGE